MQNIIIRVLGLFGTGFGIVSFQCRTHRGIMFCRTGCEMLFAIQYFLLGAYTGMAMNLLGSIRNTVFAVQVRRGQQTRCTQLLFGVLFLLGGLLTWSGIKSLIIISAKILSTLGYGMQDLRLLRLFAFFSSASWLIYNLAVGSLGGSINELFAIGSLILAAVREERQKRRITH